MRIWTKIVVLIIVGLIIFVLFMNTNDDLENGSKLTEAVREQQMQSFCCKFDSGDSRIELNERASKADLAKFENETGFVLPSTFRAWVLEYGNGAWFGIGNALRLMPLYGDQSLQVFCGAENPYGWELPSSLVPFAFDGVNGAWAFYTDKRLASGEYLIVYLDYGSIGRNAYVLCNSSFERFLNITVLFLLSGDDEELVPYWQAADPGRIAESERRSAEMWRGLYDRFEPSIRTERSDLSRALITFDELEETIERQFRE